MPAEDIIFCPNAAAISAAVAELAGEAPPELKWSGKWDTRWGTNSKGRKNYRFSFKGASNMEVGIFHDHKDGRTQIFMVKQPKFKQLNNRFNAPPASNSPPLPPPPPKLKHDLTARGFSVTTLFANFPRLEKTHPYFARKLGGNPDGVRRLTGPPGAEEGAIVPIYNTAGVMCSWQIIFSDGKRLFKKGNLLPPGHNFRLGEPDGDRVYVAEGVATGGSVFLMTKAKHAVYCAFSKNNLEPTASWLLQKHPKKLVVICMDNDGDETLKPKLKDKRIRYVCPARAGDFNDHKDSAGETRKLQELTPCIKGEPVGRPGAGRFLMTEFCDRHALFPIRELSVITGEKAALKTTGMLSYLAEEGPFAYFSNREQKEGDIRGKCQKMGIRSHYNWIDFFRQENEGFWDETALWLKEKKIKALYLDPPAGFSGGIDDQGTRDFLAPLYDLAEHADCAVIVARGFSKTEYKDPVSRVMGSAAWTSFSRAVFGIYKCQIGSKGRPAGEDPQASILKCMVRNVGPPVKGCLKFVQKTVQTVDDAKRPCNISLCSATHHTPENIDDMWKAPPPRDLDREATRAHFYRDLIEGGKTTRREIVTEAIKSKSTGGLEVKKSTVYIDLAGLVDCEKLKKHGGYSNSFYSVLAENWND